MFIESLPKPVTNKIEIGTRLGSMLLDHFIMTIAIMPFVFPAIIRDMIVSPTNMEIFNSDSVHNILFLLCLFGFTLYFCKDSFNGRSIAKRILKLQVVNIHTGEAASPLRGFIRNIFCVLWMIEVPVILISPNRRIGDFVAGTKVVYYDGRPAKKVNLLHTSIAVTLAYILMLALGFWMDGWHVKPH